MANNPKELMNQKGDDADFERLVYEALKATGEIIPTTPAEVAQAEKRLAEQETQLPASIANLGLALKRAAERRLANRQSRSMDIGIAENLARAAREGGQVSPEVEQQMRRDREDAERNADGSKETET